MHTAAVPKRVGTHAHALAGLASNASNFGFLLVVALPRSRAFPGETNLGTAPWDNMMVNVLITTATVVFVAISGSHLMATWILRKDFDVAKR